MKIINERGDDIKLTADKLPTNFTLQLLDTQSQVGMTVSVAQSQVGMTVSDDTLSQVGMTVSDATQFTIPANSYVSTTLSSLTHIYIKAGVSCLKCI